MYTHGVTNNTRRKNKKENSLIKFGLYLKNSARRVINKEQQELFLFTRPPSC